MRGILKLVAWLGGKAQDKLNAIEEREAREKALKPGTVVTLGKCRCSAKHEGTWRVDQYNFDADDYRIVRCENGEVDFAKLDALEVVKG